MRSILNKVKYAALVGMTVLAPLAATDALALSGAIFTSTGEGAIVNENVRYAGKPFVYLNGGPNNCSSAGIAPDGVYFYQVTSPDNQLLSNDPAYCRRVEIVGGRFSTPVDPDGKCAAAGGNVHAMGDTSQAPLCDGVPMGGTPVQLCQSDTECYDDTPNNGGEYKAWLIDSSCATPVGANGEPAENGAGLAFPGKCAQKTDNFKVLESKNCGFDADGNPIPMPEDGICTRCPDGSLPVDGQCPLCADGSAPICNGGVPPVNGQCVGGEDPFCPNCTSLDILVGGMKYLDASGEGVNNEGEAPIQGVNITLNAGGNPYALTTDEFGMWARKFTQLVCQGFPPPPAIEYTACEDKPLPTNWIQTGPIDGTETGDFAKANSDKCWVGTLNTETTSLDFGNVCVGVGNGGLTQGFWHNKNGAKYISDGGCLAGVTALNLRLANGNLLGAVNLKTFQSFLTSTTASNMANMLSSQLAAMWLNVNCPHPGQPSGTDLVYAPALLDFSQITPVNPVGLYTINSVITAANTELGLHGNTTSGTPGAEFRAYQEALKTTLDRGNNNLNWTGDASSCPVPESWTIITAQ